MFSSTCILVRFCVWGRLQGYLAPSVSLWGFVPCLRGNVYTTLNTGDSRSHMCRKCPQIKLLILVAMAALAGTWKPLSRRAGLQVCSHIQKTAFLLLLGILGILKSVCRFP